MLENGYLVLFAAVRDEGSRLLVGETASNNFPLIIIVGQGGANLCAPGSDEVRAGGKSAGPEDIMNYITCGRFRTIVISGCLNILHITMSCFETVDE